MSDFLDHSDFPKISWSKAVNVPTASSIAPGPPSQLNSFPPKARKKVPLKLVTQLEHLESSSPKASPEKTSESMDQNDGSLTAETLAAAASRGDLDSWDPMAFDHQSRSFNSYQEGGLGAVMHNCKESSTKTINLYINRIPAALTKDGLRNLFSQAGKVNRVYLQKAKTGQGLTFGFVEFCTIREASMAIQQFNNFDMGDGTRLIVKVAETPEQKEDRLTKERKGSFSGFQDNSFNDDFVENSVTNPLLPRYNSLAQPSPEKPKPAVASSISAEKAPESGAASLRATSGVYDQESRDDSIKKSSSPSVRSTSSSGKSCDYSPCHVCNLPTMNRCSLCKTPYCSTGCQRKDWSRHQSECKLIQHGVKPLVSDSSPAPRAPSPEESKDLDDTESGNSYDDFYAEEDEKLKALVASIQPVPNETADGSREHIANDCTESFDTPPSFATVTSTLESEIFVLGTPGQYQEAKGITMQEILSQFDVLPTPLPSIPLTSADLPEEVPVIITAYRDASHFSAMLATVQTKETLLVIKQFGDSYCGQDYVDGNNLTEELVYGYKDQTGALYRIKCVHESSNISVLVDLYDTGFRAKLTHASFLKLPEEIASLPCLRKCCSLSSLKYKREETGGVKFLKSLVEQKPVMAAIEVVSVNDGKAQIHACTLLSLDKQININEKMSESPFCVSLRRGLNQSKSVSNVSSPTVPINLPFKSPQLRSNPLLSPDQPIDKPMCLPLSQSPQIRRQAASNRPLSPGMAQNSAYRPIHMASKVLFHHPPFNETLTIIPKVVTSPSIIWAQLIHKNFSNFHNMQSDLNSVYQSSMNSSYVPCVGELCVAKFSRDQLFYRAEVICVNHNGTIDVRFIDLGNCETVCTEQLHYMRPLFRTLPKQALLFSLGGVKPSGGAPSWSDAAIIFLKDKILNRRVQVTIMSGSPATFYVEMYDLEDPSVTINNMFVERNLASALKEARTPSTPSTPGSVVGMSLSSASPLLSSHQCPVSVIKDSPAEETILPSLDSNLTPLTIPKDNTSQEAPTMPSLATADDIIPTLHGSHLEASRPLLLSTPKTLQGLVQNTCERFSTPPSSDRSDSLFEQPPRSERATQPISKYARTQPRGVSTIELPEGTTVPVIVTFVTHPNSFWVQQLSKPAVDTFLSMYSKINKQSLVSLSSVLAGDVCLCRFSEDKQIHRARVNSVSDQTATVTYLDYGNSEKVPTEKLFAMDSELLSFKQQAIFCTTNNLMNPSGKTAEWAPKAVGFFKDMTLDKEVKMKVIKCLGLKHVVEVFVETSDGERKMLDLLVEERLGVESGGAKPVDGKKNKRYNNRSANGLERSDPLPWKPFSSPKQKDKRGESISSSWVAEKGESSVKSSSSIPQQNSDKVSSWLDKEDTPPAKSPSSNLQRNSEKITQASIVSSSVYPSVATLKVVELQGEAEVLVTEVKDPQNMVIQPASTLNMENLGKLSRSLSSFSETQLTPASPNSPPVGSLCCAKFSQDQLWYRAQVLSYSSSDVVVYFVDYGNTDTVSAQSIAPCPNDLLDIPVCAIRCTLTDIAPAGPDKNWSPEVKQLILSLCSEKLIRARVLGGVASGDVKPVQLFVVDSSVDFAALLIEQGYAVSVSRLNSVLPQFSDIGSIKCRLAGVEPPDPHNRIRPEESASLLKQLTSDKLMQANVESVDPVLSLKLRDASDAGIVAKQLIQQECATDSTCKSLSSVAKSPPEPTEVSLPMAYMLKKVDLPTGVFQLVVTEVVSPAELYVQLGTPEVANMLDKLTTDLHSKLGLAEPKPLMSPPSKGSLCCAKFSSDQCWYRAEVLSSGGTNCEVRFVDYGNKDTIDMKNMTACPEDLLSVPCLAMRCGLAGVEPPDPHNRIWPEESVSLLKQLTSDRLMQAKVESVDPVLLLKLRDANNAGIVVSKQLIQQGCATGSTSLSSVAKSPPKPTEVSLPMAYILKKVDLPTGVFQLVVTEVVSPAELYIQLGNSEVANMLDKLTTDLHNKLGSAETKPLMSPPSKGSLCCAKFSSDQCWYRAEVLSSGGTNCEVRFVDYGNKDTIDMKNMTACPEDLLSVPCLAMRCGLAGVEPPDPHNRIWPEESVSLLKQLTSDRLMQAKVESVDPVLLLKLRDANNAGIVVSKQLIQQGCATGSTSLSSVAKSPPKPTEVSLPMAYILKKVDLPTGVFELVVTEVVSPAELYIQLGTPEVANMLDKLTTDLHNKLGSVEPKPLMSLPSKGSLCCAKFSSDQCWYRAEVLSSGGTNCEVRFVDYGNKDTIDIKNMTACPEDLLSVPCLALKCGLAGVEPPDPHNRIWPEESVSLLKQLTSDRLMQAKVESVDPVLLLKLRDANDAGIVVAMQLIQQECATDSTCKSLSSVAKSPPKPTEVSLPMAYVLKKVDLPAGVFQLVVTEVVSPAELYIQLGSPEVANMLDKLTTDLHNKLGSAELKPLMSLPSKGSLCCAKFSSDQCWYRAEVLSSGGTNCEVRFVDYGNKDTIDMKNMTACPEDLLSVPCLAMRCGLAGVEPPDPHNRIWPEESVSLLKQLTSDRLMQAKVESVDPVLLLKLRDANNAGIVVSKQLIQQGCATGSTSLSNVAKSPPKPTEVSLPMAYMLKKVDLPTGVFQLIVIEVVSPAELYVQLGTPEVANMLDKLTTDLHNKLGSAETKPLMSPPSKGSLCCAKFSSDQCWYRAEVLSSGGTNCEVRFVDYGNKDTIDMKNMTACPEDLLSVPCLALKCGLAGVEPPDPHNRIWPEKSVSLLKQLTSDRLMQAKVESVDPVLLLKLRDANDAGIVVAKQLIQQGCATGSTSLGSVAKPPPKTTEIFLPMAYVLKNVDLPASVFQLVVTEVVSPAELYIQLGTSEVANMLDKLTTDLHNKLGSAEPKPLMSLPSKGSLCCAKFSSDQCWYRAEVLSSVGTNCEVRFVDYGNKDTIDMKNMTACPEDLLSVPCLALKCGLAGVEPPDPHNRIWPEKSVSLLKQLTSDRLMQAKVESVDPVLLLKLRDANDAGVVVAKQLIQQGCATDSTCKSLSSVAKSPPEPTEVSLPMAYVLKKVDLPTGVFQLVVTEVVSPAELYIQLGTPEVANMLDKLTTDLHNKLGSAEPKPLMSPPSKGSLCCAKFSSDQCWYRAEVLSSVGTKCEVRFVDYGNKDTIDIKNMTACPEDLLSVPCLVTKCGLAGANKEMWPTESVSLLKQLTGNKLLKAKVMSTHLEEEIPLLKLEDCAIDISMELF